MDQTNLKFLLLDIVILIQLGYGLIWKQKEKLQEAGQHNLSI
jgi:hypothetical protein